MKRILLRTVKVLSILIVLAVCIGLLQEYVLCHADHNRQRIKGFYMEDKNSLDVVYLGASDVYSAIAPGYSYQRDGITSYLFATQADSILNYKSQLKNILSRQKDALIVIEINGAVYNDDEEVTKEANLHNYGDNVPLDAAKLEWIFQNVKENKAEFFFPIIKYHGVWNDLDSEAKYRKTIANDNKRGYDYLKGMLNETVIFQSTQRSMNSALPMSADGRQPLTALQESSLRDLLEYCRSEGLDNVVFARFPHIVVKRTYSRFERSNTVGDIIAEYGYDYINLERDIALTGIDEETDFYNLDHLNIYGQKKFTEYLDDYLLENYGLSPRPLTEAQKEEWEICSDYYDAYYAYSDALIKKGEGVELSEDCELIDKLQEYLPKK